MSSKPPRGLRLAQAGNALVLAFAWVAFVSDGFRANGILDGVYEIQARRLFQGHLSIEPGPLAIFYHDVLMYWGTYYFYWGLFPSALFGTLAALLGRLPAHYLTVFLLLFSLTFSAQKILAEILRHGSPSAVRRAPVAQWWAVPLTWLLLIVIPYPPDHAWFFSRFAVYEQQVLFGLALAMPGLYLLTRALREQHTGTLAAATVCFSLAAWTRVTWVPFAVLVNGAAVVLAWRWRDAQWPRPPASRLLPVTVPWLVMIAALLCVNYLRFDSVFDFGVRYQNPGQPLYLRNEKLFFSAATRCYNFVYNILSYYVSPDFVRTVGLQRNAYSFFEETPTGFFFVNPQFLPVLLALPLAVYRAVRERSALVVVIAVLALTTLYLNVITGIWGTMVIMRYFVEFSFFLLLTFLAVLVALLRPGIAVPIFVLLLATHVPESARRFLTVRPELRTVDASGGSTVTSPQVRTWFLTPNPVWPVGALSAADVGDFPAYAVMGLQPGANDTVEGTDLSAVYLVPSGTPDDAPAPVLEIHGLRAVREAGTVTIFFENRPVASRAIGPAQPEDVSVRLPFALPREAPYQVMLVFVAQGAATLPPRPPTGPVLRFRDVTLRR